MCCVRVGGCWVDVFRWVVWLVGLVVCTVSLSFLFFFLMKKVGEDGEEYEYGIVERACLFVAS